MDASLFAEMARIQNTHWWFRARRKILARLIEMLNLPEPAAVLELGCGAGGNLTMLQRFGVVRAVELDASARAYASKISGLNVEAGCLPDRLPEWSDQFDLVCMFDVLEHIEDDAAALRRIRQLVRRGGRVLITVPAYGWLFGPHDRAHHHFRRYTKRALRQKLREAGFRVARIGYFNTLLFPAVVVERLTNMATNSQRQAVGLPPAWLNNVLYRVFAIESMFVRHFLFPFGTSVIAIVHADY